MVLEAFHEGLLLGAISDHRPEEAEEIVIETAEFTATVVVNEPTISEESAESALGAFPGRKVQLGSGGKAVAMLREAFDLDDGKFDEALLVHVTDAQDFAGLTADGIVDRETWDAIEAYLVPRAVEG
jgi:murein L,D-transpeptidase YcbB/YkuD